MTDAAASSALDEISTTSRGYTIYREPNGVGGHRYWSDSIGGGVVIWDTCLASEDELLTCIVEERRRYEAEKRGVALQDLADLDRELLP